MENDQLKSNSRVMSNSDGIENLKVMRRNQTQVQETEIQVIEV